MINGKEKTAPIFCDVSCSSCWWQAGCWCEHALEAVGDPSRVVMKVQTIDWKTGKPLENDEVVKLIREIKGVRDVSLAVVPYRGCFPFSALTGGGLARLD